MKTLKRVTHLLVRQERRALASFGSHDVADVVSRLAKAAPERLLLFHRQNSRARITYNIRTRHAVSKHKDRSERTVVLGPLPR
jgi:hypothetical protein